MTKYFEDILIQLKNNASSLTILDLWNYYIDVARAKKFCEAIQANTSLTILDLEYNNIGDAGAEYFSEFLKKNTSLISLNLCANNIGAAGAKKLSEAVQVNVNLAILDLGCNDIGDAGAEYFSEALKDNTSLISLDLENNGIGAAGARALSKVFKVNTCLAYLNLFNNSIGDAGAEYFSEALKDNTSLISLDLENNEIGAAGIEYLKKTLQTNYTLLRLNGIEDPQVIRCLNRNKILAGCLKPLNNALGKGILLDNDKTIAAILTNIQTLFPNLSSLPENSYPREAKRLLTALGHRTCWSNIEASRDALYCLLNPFKHEPFQRLANKAMGLLLSCELHEVLKKQKLDTEGHLLSLYSFKEHLHEPEIDIFAKMALLALTMDNNHGYNYSIQFFQKTKILTQKECLTLVKTAMRDLEGMHVDSPEADLLKMLLDSRGAHSFPLKTACFSGAFYKAFNAQYPNVERFTTIDNCLLTHAQGSNTYLIDVKKPVHALTKTDIDHFHLNSHADKSKRPGTMVFLLLSRLISTGLHETRNKAEQLQILTAMDRDILQNPVQYTNACQSDFLFFSSSKEIDRKALPLPAREKVSSNDTSSLKNRLNEDEILLFDLAYSGNKDELSHIFNILGADARELFINKNRNGENILLPLLLSDDVSKIELVEKVMGTEFVILLLMKDKSGHDILRRIMSLQIPAVFRLIKTVLELLSHYDGLESAQVLLNSAEFTLLISQNPYIKQDEIVMLFNKYLEEEANNFCTIF